MAEAARAARTIVAHRVKVSTHTIIASAQGAAAVDGVELVAVDANWRPVGTPRRIAADLLVLGYGFSPATELARQAGCELRWSSPLGGWVVAHDESFRTSAAEIFVAGEPTGVSGAERSWAEGQLAGFAIADSLDAARGPDAPAARARARRRLARAGRFAKVMQDMFEPRREALAALSQTDEAIVCRCELVTSREIDQALGANPFISSANALKLECRSGMGPCQGRYCEATVAARVAQARGARIEDSGFFNAHLPVKPVPLSAYRTLGSETVRGHGLGRADSLADSSGADARADISPTTTCRKPAQ
jgi:NADPH-dependent 2,4-dienoyl-CoA reductase/sulfur reductase-like enzyme